MPRHHITRRTSRRFDFEPWLTLLAVIAVILLGRLIGHIDTAMRKAVAQ